MLYRFLIRPVLFRLPPETAHHLAASTLTSPLVRPFLALNRACFGFHSPRLETDLCGIKLANPVGLAAGFDKNAGMSPFIHDLGFGFIEIGTVTALGQPGNPKPRIFRLPRDGGLINRLGFNNDGADVVAARLALKGARIPRGGNIGKSKLTPLEESLDDYEYSFLKLKPHVDYFTVNVSSPNTPNLRKLQAREPLCALLCHLNDLNRNPRLPLLLKIAPDLSEPELAEIAEVVVESGVDGVIATNTTIGRENLVTPADQVAAIGAGGLSGRPLREMANAVIRFLRGQLPAHIPIVGVGGIFSGADAYEKIRNGASCVQIYTGLIYGGPNSTFQILRELDALLARDGFQNVAEAVGSGLT